jgi:hypothetical protein
VLQRLNGASLLEVDNRIELLRELSVEIVAGQFGFRTVNFANGALEIVLPPARFDHQRTARRVDFSAPHSDRLEITAVLDSAFEAERCELCADVFRRKVVAARAGAAAFERVIR